jgi:phospho-N-acetylmuramoyl-pentapeptide-transferase
VSQTTVLAVVATGFVISAVTGWIALRVLSSLQFRQTAYEDAPKSHQVKTGTPTMGGIAIIASLIPAAFDPQPLTRWFVLVVAGCAAIGFADDYLGIRRGKNLGLRARTKYLLTALVAVTFLRFAHESNTIFHAGGVVLVAPFWLWLLLGVLAITGTIHAVNLADGLDGLVCGTIVPPLLVLLIVALDTSAPTGDDWPIVVMLGIGGVFGFLLYNRHPAKMFMGDTGSLALGALLSGAAILTGEMLLLVLIGGVFVAEALSVLLQVTYFKLTGGKRIFRMSPLHHHFELSGWPETTVTARFWLASLVLSGVGLAIVR